MVFSMLTESKQNEIKQRIGEVFYKLLYLSTIKQIICLQPYVRNDKQIEKVAAYLKGFPAFRQYPKLTNSDFRELAQCLTFKKFDNKEIVYNVGDRPENVYFVLKGNVSLKCQNPLLLRWDWLYA